MPSSSTCCANFLSRCRMTTSTPFSGIGGFSLGLERAGMRTVAFCEIDPYCQRVSSDTGRGLPLLRRHQNPYCRSTCRRRHHRANGHAECGRPFPANQSETLEAWTIRANQKKIRASICNTRFATPFRHRRNLRRLPLSGHQRRRTEKGAGIGGERSGLWSEYGDLLASYDRAWCGQKRWSQTAFSTIGFRPVREDYQPFSETWPRSR